MMPESTYFFACLLIASLYFEKIFKKNLIAQLVNTVAKSFVKTCSREPYTTF